MFDPLTAGLVVAAFLLGGLVKGALGLGMPVVVLAMLAMVMPLREAMAIFLIPGFASNLWQATNGPWLRPLLGRMWSFLLAAIFGIIIGVTIMAGTKSEIMAMVLGALLCTYSAWALLAPRPPEPGRHEVWMSPAAGATGGVFFGMAGLFIVPGLLYLEALRIPRDQFVQALGLTFLTITGTLAVSMTSYSLVTWELAGLSALGLIPAFTGLWLGRRVRHRISEDFYRRLFFIALFVSGVYMMARVWAQGAA
ncbi:MAG: sulfite exporter TauE/SafE family protein [Pseudomonadota bacterium]